MRVRVSDIIERGTTSTRCILQFPSPDRKFGDFQVDKIVHQGDVLNIDEKDVHFITVSCFCGKVSLKEKSE